MGSFSFLKDNTHMRVLWTIISYVSSQFLIMYNRAHTFLLPWILCECVRHLRGSSRWRLTAELSWSESMRPCDGENRGIKHYHQKRLQRSLLRPHSFLQSSWWVCLFACCVSVDGPSFWINALFSSNYLLENEMSRGQKKKKKEKVKNRKVRIPPVFPSY